MMSTVQRIFVYPLLILVPCIAVATAALSHVAVDEILAAVQHLVLPLLPRVDVQAVLPVLWNLQEGDIKATLSRDLKM